MTATTVRYEAENRSDLLLALRDVTEERRLALVKSDFVSNASHELRTPLTSVRGYLEALEDAAQEGAPVDPDFVATALRNAIRMEHLIDDLLELSKAESGGPPVEKEAIPLPAFLERIVAAHREEAVKGGKTLLVAGEEATLRADIRKLALAVSNLVDNAIKYGKEGGTVRLGGRAEGSGVAIEVADDGPGIPPEHLPRIFERFYRVDKGRSRDLGGTGLGLSIAKHIVESHGGSIQAESRLGMGTRFLIRIPG
jgi:two-component system phosphate regulon sensor histidine kinase PhoR